MVFEDSRLQSNLFSGSKTTVEAKRLKIARDVGGIDAWCTLLEQECKRLGLRSLGVSPKDKGAKVAASAFDHITGWPGRTSEHERDAAMVPSRVPLMQAYAPSPKVESKPSDFDQAFANFEARLRVLAGG